MNVLRSVVPNQAWLRKGGGVFLSMGGDNRTRQSPRSSRSSRIDPECFRCDELVEILVVGSGKLVSEVLICKPDLTGTDIRSRQPIRKSCFSRHRPLESS